MAETPRQRYARLRASKSTDAPSDIISELGGEKTLEALPIADRSVEKKFREDVRKIEDPDVRAQVRDSAEPSLADLKQVRKGALRAAFAAQRRGDTELATKLRKEAKAARDTDPPAEGVVEKATSAGRKLFEVLDAPQHLVRQVTTKVFGENEHGLYDRDISASEWTENIRKTADKGGVRGALASAVVGAGRASALPLGSAAAVTGGVTSAIADAPGVVRGERSIGDLAKRAGESAVGSYEDAADLMMTMGTDPTSFVSAGVGGAGKTAAGATLRGAQKAGLAAADAERLSKGVGGLASKIAGRPDAFKHVERAFGAAFRRGGRTTQEGIDEARRVFGEGGEFFGRGQLEAHLPFMSNRGIALAPALGGQDFAIGKAAKKVADPILDRLKRRPLFDQAKQAAKSMSRSARGEAAMLEGSANDDLAFKMSQLPQGHRLADPKVREAILSRHIDPSWDEIPLNMNIANLRNINPQHIVERGGQYFQLVPKADHVPAARLDAEFGPGAKQYVDALTDWHNARASELLGAGALTPGQLTRNPISNQYRHRIYTSEFGALEDIIAKNSRQGAAASSITAARAQKGHLSPEEAERLGHVRGEKDYLKAAPQYARQAARATAKANFERAIAKHFEIPPTQIPNKPKYVQGSKMEVRSTVVNIDGRDVHLPADIANIMTGTFDQGLSTISRALRNAGADASPVGRGVLKVLESYESLGRRFKGLVLKTPAYHAVNLVDDLVKMASAGMHNPAKYIRQAGELMKSGSTTVRGKPIRLKDANRHNIGVDAAQRFEQQGSEAATRRLRREIEKSSGSRSLGSKAREAYEKVDDFSSEVGQAWENRAKIAHWLWRLDAGDSPEIAAKNAFDVLIDYGDRSRLDHLLGWFIPFIKYAKESPAVTARLAAKNPGALNALDRGLEMFGEEGHEPPQYVRERGNFVTLPPRGQQLVGEMRGALGGSRAKKGLDLGFVPRLTVYESLAPLGAAAQGNLDPLALLLGPAAKAGVEMLTDRDLLTKKELKAPDSLLDLFPAGTPVVPTWLQADVGENPYGSRYFPPYLASPGTLMAGNIAINRMQGGQGAVATFGGHRPYTSRQDPADIHAMQILKYASGVPVYETTPADAVRNAAYDPAVQSALANMQGAEKQRKQERKSKRR